MKDEYDFSKGERGKFYKPDATLNLPVYLDDDVRRVLQRQAKEKGVEVNELVNELLKHEIGQGR
jgi:hypothetical protein